MAVQAGTVLPELFPVIGDKQDNGCIISVMCFQPVDKPFKGSVQVRQIVIVATRIKGGKLTELREHQIAGQLKGNAVALMAFA
jgi:hypothetical protein